MKMFKNKIVQAVIGLMLVAGPAIAYNNGDLPVGANVAGNIVATVANKLSAFASTTSAELASVISNETGSGNLVFSNSPTLVTPNIGTATGSITGNAATATALQTARTINGVSFDGTGNIVVTSAAGTLTGTTLASNVVTSSLTSVGTLGTLTVTAPITGSVTGNAGTVTTNANLTGPITSVGNATSVAAQTGTGSTFVMQASPTLTTPNIGAATATSVNGNVITTGTGTLTLGSGKTLTASNTLTLTGTDGSTAAFGAGGTVAYLSNNLGAFSSTTSAQLASVISNETGTGALVFGTSPVFTTPNIGTATGSITGNAATATTLSGTGTVNSLAGYDNAGAFSGVSVGSGLSLSGGTITASGVSNVFTAASTDCSTNVASALRTFLDAHDANPTGRATGTAIMPPGCYLINDLGGGTTGINLIEQQPNTVTYKYDTGHYFIHNSDTKDTSLFDNKTAVTDICVGDQCSGIQFVNTDDKLTRLTVASTAGYSPGDYVKLTDSVSLPSRIGTTKTITNVAWNGSKCIVTFSGSHGYSNTVQIFFNGIVGTGRIGSLSGQDGGTFNTLVDKFALGDTVTGGSSGVTATVSGITYNKNSTSSGVINLKNASGTFTAGETITGAKSGSAVLASAFGWGRTYNITSESSSSVSLQTLDNAGGGTTGTNVDCSTGAYASGGTSSQQNGWAGEASRVAQVDPTGPYVYLTQPLQYSNLYVNQPILYRFAWPYTVSIIGGKVTANGDTSDVTNTTASNAAVDIIGIPEVKIRNFEARNTWDAAIIMQGSPNTQVDNLKSHQMPNRATLIVSNTSNVTVSSISAAAQAVVTTSGSHRLVTGQSIAFSNLPTGWTSLTAPYTVEVLTSTTFKIKQLGTSTYIDTSAFTPAFSGSSTTESKVITSATSANPAVFTSAAHGFGTTTQLGFFAGQLPTGWSGLEGKIYHVVNQTTDTFQLQDTNNEPVSSLGLPAWSGNVATADTDDVTGLGYTISTYGSAFGTVINGIECWEGRHCVTTDGQQSTWTTVASSTSAIWGQGMPTWVTVENGVSHGSYGIAWDSHQEAARFLWRNLSCERPLRGYQYGSYQGRCFQARGKDQTYVNMRAYAGTGGGYVRSVAIPHDSSPTYTFIDDYFEDLKNLRDGTSTASTVGDSTAITTEDGTGNLYWPILNIDNTNFSKSYIGVDIAKTNEVHVGRSNFTNVKEPFRQWGGTLLDMEGVINDKRTMDYTGLSAASSTSWTPATGAQTFTVPSGGAWRPNMAVMVTSTSSPSTIYGIGKVVSYSSTSLATSISTFAGSGAHTDWKLVADWPTVQVRSDVSSGAPYTRINNLHTYNSLLLPSIAFGEDDATATKNYDLGTWTDQSVASVGKLYLSPWQTTFSALTDTSRDLNSAETVGGSAIATAAYNLGQFASTTSAQLASVISNETGSGALCFATSPTLVTPTLGVATATSINGLTLTSSTGALTIANLKTLTASNTLTFAGTDGSTLNVGTGGTLGTAAYTAASAYEVPLTFSTGLTRTTNTVTVNTSQNIATLSNLTSNGFVKTGGGVGTLSVDTNTYAQASQVFDFLGFVEGPTNKLYTLAYKPDFAGTINTTKTICTGGGTATVQFSINGTPLGAANAATSSGDSVAQSTANTFVSGDIISATVSANASCIDLSLTGKYSRTLQ